MIRAHENSVARKPSISGTIIQKVCYEERCPMNASTTVSVDLSFEQLTKALRRLPTKDRVALWRLLDEDIDRPAITKRFSLALQAIRSAHPNVTEDEVMADVLKATQEARARRHNAQSRS